MLIVQTSSKIKMRIARSSRVIVEFVNQLAVLVPSFIRELCVGIGFIAKKVVDAVSKLSESIS